MTNYGSSQTMQTRIRALRRKLSSKPAIGAMQPAAVKLGRCPPGMCAAADGSLDECADAYCAMPQTETKAWSDDALCPNCDRLTEIRHCQACGCDFIQPKPAECGAVPTWVDKLAEKWACCLAADHLAGPVLKQCANELLSAAYGKSGPPYEFVYGIGRRINKDAAPATSESADYECRAHECRRVRVEMQAEIKNLREQMRGLLRQRLRADAAAVVELVEANKRQARAIEALLPLLGSITDERTCDATAEAHEASADFRGLAIGTRVD